MNSYFRIYHLSEKAVVIEWEQRIDAQIATQIQQLQENIRQQSFSWLEEMVPAYASLTLYYNPILVLKYLPSAETAAAQVNICLSQILESLTLTPQNTSGRRVEIPVCYGGEYGPDLGLVAQHCGLSEQEVIHLHSSSVYQVYMIGFVPGFAYMGGMPEQLSTPRRQTPRPKVLSGSVGIAGKQTGIYPMEITGGWQIIGRTPLLLFNVEKNPPSFLQAGDEVVFVPTIEFTN